MGKLASWQACWGGRPVVPGRAVGPARARALAWRGRRRAPVKLSDNPVVRMLAVVVLVAAGIRVIYELLLPVAPYLLAVLVAFTVIRLLSWYRGRW